MTASQRNTNTATTTQGRRRRALLCLTVSALASGTASMALAAEAAADRSEIEELVVTARRREESLLETPIAVSIASGEKLRDKDITVAPDLIKLTPGLTAQLGANQSRRTSRYAIRGQGGNPGVGVVTYFAEVPQIGEPFFDLENIQVLKGPVGTLFGRVTTGGAILFTPKMPGKEPEGFIDAKVGQYGRRDVEFGFGGEVIDDVLAVRLSGQILKSRGFTKNLYDNGWLDGRKGHSGRIIVKFTPNSHITNTTILMLDRQEDPVRSGPATLVRPFAAGSAALNAGNTQRIAPAIAAFNGIACPGNICPTWLAFAEQNVAAQAARSRYVVNENHVNNPFPNERQKAFVNTTVFDVTDNIRLKNIFSRQRTDAVGPGSQAIDSSPLPMLEQVWLARPGPRAQTEELQLQADLFDNRLQFTGGYFNEKNWSPYYQSSGTVLYGGYTGEATSAAVCTASGARSDPGPDGKFYCYIGARSTMSKFRNKDEAGFAQATFKVTDKLSITGGYRYTWSRRASATSNFTSVTASLLNGTVPSRLAHLNGMPDVLVPGVVKTLPGEAFQTLKFKKGTYTLAAQYQFSPDFMVYATSRRGYNPGGRNNRAPVGQEIFGPEVVTDYELGAKLSFTVGEMRGLVSFDVYRDDYNDAQRNTTQPVNGVATVYVANVAKGRIQGFDLDGTIRSGAFALSGFVTLTDAKYLEYPNRGQIAAFPPPFDLREFYLANTSKWVWGVQPSVDLGRLAGSSADVVLSGNVYHRGAFASSEPNIGIEANRLVPGNTTLDLRLDWRNIRDTGLSAALAVTNVTDYNGKIGGNELRGTNGVNLDVFMPPRMWYVEMNYKF